MPSPSMMFESQCSATQPRRRRDGPCMPSCDTASLEKRVPIVQWLPKYKKSDILSDAIAGITVGLTLIPQSIAYAGLAGLEPQYGLYSAFMGSFVYIIFGTTKEVNLGPVSLLSLLTFNYTHDLGPDCAVLLCFLAGCIELLCGLLHLGFLVEFVSTPVVTGFTAAAAVTIASSQIKNLLGIKFESHSFIQTWSNIIEHIGETKLWDTVLGGSCCIVLISLKLLKDHVKIGEGQIKLTKSQIVLSQLVWFIATARNAIVVFICGGISYYLSSHNTRTVPFKLTGRVKSGLPSFQFPPFSTQVGNQTYNFEQMVQGLGSGVIVIPIVAIIENIAIGKAFSKGRILDATQEMMTLGLCNIAGSMVSSMPVTGAFSRSAISNASGVRSPLAGLYTGVMVILALSLLTPYFYFIPTTTLAAVIMCAVIYLIEYEVVMPMWRISKLGLVTLVATFLVCLLVSMEVGIFAGVAVDIATLLYSTARPEVKIDLVANSCGARYILATPRIGLLFPAIDHVREAIQVASMRLETQRCSEDGSVDQLPVVLDFRNVLNIDYTTAEGMQCLICDLLARRHLLVFIHVRPRVLRVLTHVCHQDLHVVESEGELTVLLKEYANCDALLTSSSDSDK